MKTFCDYFAILVSVWEKLLMWPTLSAPIYFGYKAQSINDSYPSMCKAYGQGTEICMYFSLIKLLFFTFNIISRSVVVLW